MKKFISVFAVALTILMIFVSCSSTTSAWSENVNETFESLPAYSTGEIQEATFEDSCHITVNDDNYDHFAAYIEKLKDAGFEYFPYATEPENYTQNDEGQASWRASDGSLYIMVIFNPSGTDSYEQFGNVNVCIFGYSELPDGWQSTTETTTSKSKSKDKSSKTTTEAEETTTKKSSK